jgi:hypothetical protein
MKWPPSTLQSNQEKRRSFCMGCIKRIARDFPGELETLANISILAPYFKGEYSYKEQAVNTTLLNVLRQIVSQYGVETLSGARRVKALLADLAVTEPNPRKKHIHTRR